LLTLQAGIVPVTFSIFICAHLPFPVGGPARPGLAVNAKETF
jgi:hypothetical protein